MKVSQLRQLIREEIRGVLNENDTPQFLANTSKLWPDAIRNFIITNLSNDEKELYLVVKALEKTLESFKNEMGEYDPDFHYDI